MIERIVARRGSLCCLAPLSLSSRSSLCGQTRDLSAELAPEHSSFCPRFDVLVLITLCLLLCLLLRVEYGLDVFGWFLSQLRRMLDPGPLQTANSDDIEPEGINAAGRAAMDAALRAVKGAVGGAKGTIDQQR